jgi:homocitrate synthase NifV
MIRITDVTLCTLDSRAVPKEKLLELYSLLLLTGINFLEIDVQTYEIIHDSVDKNKTILKVQDPTEIRFYPGFMRYVCRYSGFNTPSETLSEIQVNDIREVNILNRFSEYQNIRIVGFDDLMQHDYLSVFKRIQRITNGKVEFCPQNRYFCASALATEWILNGGESVVVSFNGSGGFAALEEVIMALRITKRHKPNQDLSVLHRIKSIYQELSGENITQNKAIIGSNIFEVESGIHVDGIYKNGSTYEPFEPSVVGMERKIIIGKHSGRTSIEIKLREHNLTCTESIKEKLLEAVQSESIRLSRSITEDEFINIALTLEKG